MFFINISDKKNAMFLKCKTLYMWSIRAHSEQLWLTEERIKVLTIWILTHFGAIASNKSPVPMVSYGPVSDQKK